MPTKSESRTSQWDVSAIRQAIREALITQEALSEELADEIAFHMVDWSNELAALVAFFDKPRATPASAIGAALLSFLQHAPQHVATAAELLTGSPDPGPHERGS